MSKRVCKRVCILILLFCTILVQNILATEFEGNINFVKQTLYDTTLFTFIIKNEMVRIDEKNQKNEIIQSLIINISSKSITALSPSQKLYTNIYKNRSFTPVDIKITKSTNYKVINGYKCTQWRVRDNTFNTEVSFWVSTANFDFFSKVINLLNKTEDYYQYGNYFNMIPGNEGYLPILIVARTLLREEKYRIVVKDILPQPIDNREFVIPKGYKCLLN